jgi:Nidogen-like
VSHVDKFNSFQLILTNQSSIRAGDFDITFNYAHITWETGDASGGTGGIGGVAARAGYSAGTGDPNTSIELAGSGLSGALLDGGSNALVSTSYTGDPPGRDTYPIRN